MTQPQSQHWASQQERGAYWGLLLMLWLYRLGGRFLFTLVLYPVMAYFFLFARTARDASREFLLRAQQAGSPALPHPPGYWLVYRHLLTFGHAVLDKIAVWLGGIDSSRVEFPYRETLRAKIAEGRGGVILASHLGNLEICRAMSRQTPTLKLNILVHTRHAQKFNDLLRKVNPGSDLTFLQVTEVGPDTAMLLQQKIDAGEFLAIVGDRIPVADNKRMSTVMFLNHPAAFPQGPFILAALLKCPVYTLFCVQDNGHYRVDVEPFADQLVLQRKTRMADLERYIQQFATRLEQYALRYPLQWFNFFPFWNPENGQRVDRK